MQKLKTYYRNIVYNKSMLANIRNHSPKRIYEDKEKKCAVLIPLIQINNEYHILFEVRSLKLKKQPGEICFPGGRLEEDVSMKDCALRETKEELLIREEDIEYIGALDYFISHNNLRVDVFVGILHNYQFTFNEEVEEVFTVPLSFFLNNEAEIYINKIQTIPDSSFPFDKIPNGENYKFSTGTSDTPVYQFNNRFIWGLTARILYHNLKYFRK